MNRREFLLRAAAVAAAVQLGLPALRSFDWRRLLAWRGRTRAGLDVASGPGQTKVLRFVGASHTRDNVLLDDVVTVGKRYFRFDPVMDDHGIVIWHELTPADHLNMVIDTRRIKGLSDPEGPYVFEEGVDAELRGVPIMHYVPRHLRNPWLSPWLSDAYNDMLES